jgi:predicted regulator of Ras-like GTPase activity (Roadblock/LC7/MglB family)
LAETSAGSWSLGENDYRRIVEHLDALLKESNSRCAMLVDRTGQLVANAGEQLNFDSTAFASLTAADFSANDQLAKMIGEPEFASLFHQGEKESMYVADVARRVILVVLFDERTTVGMVRLRVKQAVTELGKLFDEMFTRAGSDPAAPGKTGGLLEGAEDEIDKLFGD